MCIIISSCYDEIHIIDVLLLILSRACPREYYVFTNRITATIEGVVLIVPGAVKPHSPHGRPRRRFQQSSVTFNDPYKSQAHQYQRVNNTHS